MKVLVTGHKGYIGSKIYKKCQELGWEVLGIDLKEGKDIININYLEEYINFEPEIIFHLAALPRIDFSMKNPSDACRTNVLGTSCILQYARSVGCRRVIFSSSSSIYGNGEDPISIYGLQKLQSELEMKFFSDNFGVDTVSLRYFNVYSEDQQVTDAYPTVIAAWMQCIKDKKDLIVYGDGRHTRDYIHVDDIVSVNIFCASYKDNFCGKFYDVGTGENYSLKYIMDYINSKHEVTFNFQPEKKSDPLYTLAKCSLKKIGWGAKISFQEGIKKCF